MDDPCHIGYINSVVTLCKRKVQAARKLAGKPLPERLAQKLLLTRQFVLNEGEPPAEVTSRQIGQRLKHDMNVLRSAFFNTAAGRVAYEEMRGSKAYRDYRQCTLALQRFDPDTLKSRKERLAFWINLFNVLTIHGVVALGIRDLVREVPRFFRRIAYRIGGMTFCADDIEHGILRGNYRFPQQQ